MAKGNPVVRKNQFDSAAALKRMQDDMAKMEAPQPLPASSGDSSLPPLPRVALPRFKGRLAQDGELFTRRQAFLPDGHTIQNALEPTYWRDHVANLIGEGQVYRRGAGGDTIELFQKSTRGRWLLQVDEIGPGLMRCSLIMTLREPDLCELPEGSPYITRWNEGKGGHEILRRGDNYLMGAGPFQTLPGAIAWIRTDMAARSAA